MDKCPVCNYNTITMKTVTVEQFKSFRPCWLETVKGRKRFARIAAIRNEWTALDVLNLSDVSAQDKLWSVLREEFIEVPTLHEFSCRCAEYALSFVASPDPRSIAAIEAKRKWLRGEITDAELHAARDEARYAAQYAAWDFAWDAACAAAQDATMDDAWSAARVAALHAARVAALAATMDATMDDAWDATMDDAWDATMDAAREHEVEILRELLEE